MKLSCPECDAPIAAEDVQLDLMIAKCANCDNVFSFAENLGRSEEETLARVASSGTERRPPTPTEHSVHADEDAGNLVLTVPWWSRQYLVLVPFLLFWNGFLVVWWGISLSQGLWEMAAFSLLHVAAGVGLSYHLVCGFVNSTTITVSPRGIDVAHGPLPWPGSRTLASDGLEQLYVEQRIIRSKNSSRTVYDLKAHHRKGDLTLVSALPDPNNARYLEHQIEQRLGIVDQPVPGEHL